MRASVSSVASVRVLGICLCFAAAVAAAGCGGSSSAHTAPSRSGGKSGAAYDAPVSMPVHEAAPIHLRNYTGKPVNLSQYKGKAVLLTFIYDHCPDVCPLIVGNLHTSLGLLGPNAHKVQIVAVSTDPKGDTPKTVAAFLRAHQMTGKMDYLIGSAPQLHRVWTDWGIVAKRAKTNPDLVEHSALIIGIGASGNVRVAYPANFKPSWIAHDVPVLATQ